MQVAAVHTAAVQMAAMQVAAVQVAAVQVAAVQVATVHVVCIVFQKACNTYFFLETNHEVSLVSPSRGQICIVTKDEILFPKQEV